MHELIAPKEVKISRIREIESLSPNNYKELKIQNTNEEYLSFFLKDVPFERGIEPGSTAYVEKSNQIFLRNSCIDNIRFSNDKEKYIYLNPNYYDACTVENEDVLFCTDANIGDCCLYLGVNEKAVYSSGIVKLNFKNEKYKYYVMGFIRDDYFREQLNTLTPKGSTIRHSRDLLLNCRIPICFEDWIFSLYENLIKNITYTEYICNMKMRQTEEMIDSELLVREYPYQNPSIKKLTEKSRLDSGIYSKEVYQWQKNIENYKNGYTDLEGFGFRTKRGPSLQVRDLGRSIQTENYRKGYNVLIYPSDISDAGFVEKVTYLGARIPVWFLSEKYILFSSEGTIGKTFVVCDDSMKFTTNIHGTMLYPIDNQTDIIKSIFLGLYLNYMRHKGILTKMSVGANGGSFAVGYWNNIIIPCVDEAFQKKLAKIYDNKIQLNPVVFDKENLMEAGIYQLNNFLIKCKELLKKVCEDIKNDNLESEKFYKKYFE